MRRCLCLLICLLCGCTPLIDKPVEIHEESGLMGYLSVPDDCDVGVVLLSGSGANDADYNVDHVPIYRDLSDSLFENGIASIRMDKRNVVGECVSTIQDEILDDALSAVRILKEYVDTVFILGHSLSAYVLPTLSEASDGLIFMAGSVTPLEEIYALQLIKQCPDDVSVIQNELEMIQNLEIDTGFSWFGLKESWWISVHDLDLLNSLKLIDVPVLILHGSDDSQIDCSELERYRTVFSEHQDAEFVLFQDLNHYFVKKDSVHLDESVIDHIVAWILKRS